VTPLDAIRVIAGEVRAGFTSLPLYDDDNVAGMYSGADGLAAIPTGGAVRLLITPGDDVPVASPGLDRAVLVATLEVYRPKGQGQGQPLRDAAALVNLFNRRSFLAPSGGTGQLTCVRTRQDVVGSDKERDLYQVNAVLIFHNYSHPT